MKRTRDWKWVGIAFLYHIIVLHALGQHEGTYDGNVYLQSEAGGIVSPEVLQGTVKITVDARGRLRSEGVGFLAGRVNANGNVIFDVNGFFLQRGTIENGTLMATGELSTPGSTLTYRLEATRAGNPPVITRQPESQSVESGGGLTLTVAVQNGETFRWFKDGLPLAEAGEASLRLTSVSADDAGTYYVEISNAHGKVLSDEFDLSVISASPNPEYRGRMFRKLVDTKTSIPSAEGTFEGFGAASLGGDSAYFVHHQNFDNVGIYGVSGSGLFKVVERGDPSPGGIGVFTRFTLGTGPDTPRGDVIFAAESGTAELLQWRSGVLSTLLDLNEDLPEQPGVHLGAIRHPIAAGGRILFQGAESGPVVNSLNLYWLENGMLQLAADSEALAIGDPNVPADSSFVVTTHTFDFDGKSFAVVGRGPVNSSGIHDVGVFATFNDGPLKVILPPGATVPGTEVPVTNVSTVQVGGDWVYMGAQGRVSREAYLLRGNGERLETLVGPETRMPDGVLGRLTSPGVSDLVADGDRVFFTAGSNRGAYGIFAWENGSLEYLLSRDDRFDGRAPQLFRLWPQSVDEDDLLVHVIFDFAGKDAALYTTRDMGSRVEVPSTPSTEGEPPIAPTITGVLPLGGSLVAITFESVLGSRYQVQYSHDLMVWDNSVSELLGTGNALTWIDDGQVETSFPADLVGRRFYRVQRLP